VVDFKKLMTPKRSPLNPEQKAAVEHVDGPLRIGAVAGSGKTTALVERCAYLIEQQRVEPWKILMITFSSIAKTQMERRIQARMPHVDAGSIARTFHSIGLDIFRQEIDPNKEWEIDKNGALYRRVIQDSFRYLQVEPNLKLAMAFSARVKMEMLGTSEALRRLGQVDPRMLEEAELLCNQLDIGGNHVEPDDLVNVFNKAESMRTEGFDNGTGQKVRFVTFDDMLYQSAMLLRHTDVKHRWASRWRYIMADEHQDTSLVQNAVGDALASIHKNYCIVGDPAQSVFSFRGSHPELMLSFDKTFEGTKTIAMHRNYRSGREIVALANEVLAKMPAATKLDMVMTSERNSTSFVDLHAFEDPEAEASGVAQNCIAHNKAGVAWKDQAVLVRMNYMTREIEVQLAKSRVPYRLVSGTSFYSLREVKMLFGYMRIVASRATQEDLEYAIQYPSRFLGKEFIKRVLNEHKGGGDYLPAVEAASKGTRQERNALEWLQVIRYLRGKLDKETPWQLAVSWRGITNVDDWLKKKGNDDDDVDTEAVSNLDEAISYASTFETVKELLDAVDETEKFRANAAHNRDAVTISTVHKAKGAEWPVVYIVQMGDALFPSRRGDALEERRLFYVALTRAMDELWVSWSKTNGEGTAEVAGPGRLVNETSLVPSSTYEPGRKAVVAIGSQLGLLP
jgi:DNA helicase-2/ATP-dependent DNA helicase PcrA